MRDVIERPTVVIIGKPLLLRLTIRSLVCLEDAYGTVGAALSALAAVFGGEFDIDEALRTTDRFIRAMSRGDAPAVTTETLINAYDAILEAIRSNSPNADGDKDTQPVGEHKPLDFDSWYYSARVRLGMSEDEFWDCSPRKLFKLLDLLSGTVSNESKPIRGKDARDFLNSMGL